MSLPRTCSELNRKDVDPKRNDQEILLRGFFASILWKYHFTVLDAMHPTVQRITVPDFPLLICAILPRRHLVDIVATVHCSVKLQPWLVSSWVSSLDSQSLLSHFRSFRASARMATPKPVYSHSQLCWSCVSFHASCCTRFRWSQRELCFETSARA
jgi:hypothetical protein